MVHCDWCGYIVAEVERFEDAYVCRACIDEFIANTLDNSNDNSNDNSKGECKDG